MKPSAVKTILFVLFVMTLVCLPFAIFGNWRAFTRRVTPRTDAERSPLAAEAT